MVLVPVTLISCRISLIIISIVTGSRRATLASATHLICAECYSVVVTTISGVSLIPIALVTCNISLPLVGIPADLMKIHWAIQTSLTRTAHLFCSKSLRIIGPTRGLILFIPRTAVTSRICSTECYIEASSLTRAAHFTCNEIFCIVSTTR